MPILEQLSKYYFLTFFRTLYYAAIFLVGFLVAIVVLKEDS
jgi:hypothetical protein